MVCAVSSGLGGRLAGLSGSSLACHGLDSTATGFLKLLPGVWSGRYLERQGLLERDAESGSLAGDVLEGGAMEQLLGSSITYRVAVRPQRGHKVFMLQTLPASVEPFDARVGKVAGFSLRVGVAARAAQRQKLERLSR